MIICERHIRKAKQVAFASDIVKAKVSAIAISKGGGIIATANNRKLRGDYADFSIHAERALIKKLNKLSAFERYHDITIIVFRISSYGICMARPCAKCQELLNKYPVKIMFTNEKGEIECL